MIGALDGCGVAAEVVELFRVVEERAEHGDFVVGEAVRPRLGIILVNMAVSRRRTRMSRQAFCAICSTRSDS